MGAGGAGAYGQVLLTNCTLPAVLAAIEGGGVVVFSCDTSLVLTNAIVITHDTVLDATGRTVQLSGSEVSRLFVVNRNAKLTLRGLTLSGGRQSMTNVADGLSARGGVILNQGALLIEDCHFAGNNVEGSPGAKGANAPIGNGDDGGDGGPGLGGVIYNDGGAVVLTNTIFFGNSAKGGGGGDGGAGGAFGNGSYGGKGGNGGVARGGVLFNSAGVVEIVDCTFASNRVAGAFAGFGGGGTGVLGFDGEDGKWGSSEGGAIFNDRGIVRIRNSTFLVNGATGVGANNGRAGRNGAGERGQEGGPGSGGALFVSDGTVAMTNVTFVSNFAVGGKGGRGGDGSTSGFGGDGGDGGVGGTVRGAAVFHERGATEIVNGTFSGNSLTPGDGGEPGAAGGITGRIGDAGNAGTALGAALFGAGPGMTIRNTILANSRLGGNAAGTILDGGNNISTDDTPALGASGSRNRLNPVLGSLGDHGGQTLTMSLGTNSPAIDTGNDSFCLPYDQRQARRNGPCDIGAFEFGGRLPDLVLTARRSTNDVVLTWPVAKKVVLEQSDSAVATNTWTTVSSQPVRVGVQQQVTIPMANRLQFFRLRRQ